MTTKLRWNSNKGGHVGKPRVDAFITEVIEVSKRHGLAISHEDHGGSFRVTELDEEHIEWLQDANDDTKD